MPATCGPIERLGRLSLRDWGELLGTECRPFGTVCAEFAFRPKDHHVAVRDHRGRLAAAAGWSCLDVEIGERRFPVMGIGALVVRQDARGAGLSATIMEALRAVDPGPGITRQLLLCEPHLEPVYRRWGCRSLDAPVWVDQPTGPVLWPLRTMWRPLVEDIGWPPGPIRVVGLPF